MALLSKEAQRSEVTIQKPQSEQGRRSQASKTQILSSLLQLPCHACMCVCTFFTAKNHCIMCAVRYPIKKQSGKNSEQSSSACASADYKIKLSFVACCCCLTGNTMNSSLPPCKRSQRTVLGSSAQDSISSSNARGAETSSLQKC